MSPRIAVALALLLETSSACADKCPPALGRMLDASSRSAYNEALRDHGPVEASELPCLVDAAGSWFASKRHNAATTLRLVHADDAVRRAAWIQVASDTSDVAVWAILSESLLDHPIDGDQAALDRRKMVGKALDYSDAEDRGFAESVQATGLRAGVWTHAPGLEAEVMKRVATGQAELKAVALQAMTPELARTHLTELLDLLSRYESKQLEEKQRSSMVFVNLVRALVRSDDPRGVQAAHDAVAKDYLTPKFINTTRPELMDFRNEVSIYPEPATDAWLFELMRSRDVLAPTAADVLTTRVWAGDGPPRVALIELCVATLERTPLTDTLWYACDTADDVLEERKDPLVARQDASEDPKRRARLAPLGPTWRADCTDLKVEGECNQMLYFMETGVKVGSAGKNSPKQKSTGLEFGKVWLAACAASHACAP